MFISQGCLGVRRVLENHGHAVNLDLLDGLLDVAVRRDKPHGAGRDALAQALADVTVRTGGRSEAVLVEQPPVHGIAGVDVLGGNREIHEVDGCDDGDLVRTHVRFVHNGAHATPVVSMRVRIDDGRDGKALPDMLLKQLPGRTNRFGGDQGIEIQPVFPRMKVMSDRSKPRTW